MQIEELILDHNSQWLHSKGNKLEAQSVELIIVFGEKKSFEQNSNIPYLRQNYPLAKIVGASTAGTIESGHLSTHALVATLIAFDTGWTDVQSICAESTDEHLIAEKTQELLHSLESKELKHIFLLANGLEINGSAVAKGINKAQLSVSVTGGLAGDDYEFKETLTLFNDTIDHHQLVAIGFYGPSLHVNIGCEIGWDEFGAQRVVTKSEGNIVYEFDHKPAIKLYEDYLSDYIQNLPMSALNFPLSVRSHENDKGVVRVMMGINEDRSLVFAGDVPEGSLVRLMKTTMDNLIEVANKVGSLIDHHHDKTSLALAVSCSGRRSVLKEYVDEELETLQIQLGRNSHLFGFYSYGELSPFTQDDALECRLHNQTMTLTVIYED